MRISERSIKRIGEIITGDKQLSPYRSGPQLVKFFNELGGNDVYGQGFPSRWQFAENRIREHNGSSKLKTLILSALDPRDFLEKELDIIDAVNHINKFLEFDGYEIVLNGKDYNIIDKSIGEILLDIQLEPNHLSHQFIKEQVEKCRTKISNNDYDGAITNARSLVEAVLIAIEKELDTNAITYDGNLPKLYKRIQKHLNLSPDNVSINQSLRQTLSGFVSIIDGLSGLSNKMGDRHAREYNPSKHHAVLLVNSAMTFTNFIFDTNSYQSKNRKTN